MELRQRKDRATVPDPDPDHNENTATTTASPPTTARSTTVPPPLTPPSTTASACRRCFVLTFKLLASLVLIAAVVAAVAYYFYFEETQLFLMRFFRDLARSKAHARLHGGQSHAMLAVLTGSEDLLPIPEVAEGGLSLTAEELGSFNGVDGTPLYLGIMGRVYDVSRGKAFYAKGRSYHHYVARDATRSFATGCTKEECLVPSLVGCTEQQKQEALRWLELYEHHDRFVGMSPRRGPNCHPLHLPPSSPASSAISRHWRITFFILALR
eukprot:m.47294 g.47294  ORF g.47294 m.47294 type:complete len:268 (+) comp15589_c0_seq2:247-1050(+)